MKLAATTVIAMALLATGSLVVLVWGSGGAGYAHGAPGRAVPAATPTPPFTPPNPEAPLMKGAAGGEFSVLPTAEEWRPQASWPQPGPTGSSPAKIVPEGDGHAPIGAANIAAPYRWVARLDVTFPSGTFECSGFLIGPTTVITAGHCLFDPGEGGWAINVAVTPGQAGAAKPFGTLPGATWSSTHGWVVNGDPCFDYGAVIMPGPFAGLAGPFFAFGGVFAVGQTGRLSGYPMAAHAHDANSQFRHDEVITGFTCSGSELGSYHIDTCGAQSGSPVWYPPWAEQPTVKAVHTYGHELADASCPHNAGQTPCLAGDNCGRSINDAATANFNWWLAISPPAPTPTPPPGAVGGILEPVDLASLPAETAESGGSRTPYMAGGLATAAVALAAGGWYARRRWLR